MEIIEQTLGRGRTTKIRAKAVEALRDSDLTEVFETAGIQESFEAGAALKAILAEKMADCTIRALREAKRRKMKVGAAAIIIAAQQ